MTKNDRHNVMKIVIVVIVALIIGIIGLGIYMVRKQVMTP